MLTAEIRNRFPNQLIWLDRLDSNTHISRMCGYNVRKRILDLSLLILTLPAWLPLLALCGLLIKLDAPKEAISFLQVRTGHNGRPFRMIKFRTMVSNAEQLKSTLLDRNERTWPDFRVTNDPRVTRVGRFLRKTSLDELPQLFNVLRGEMSLVGPRPTSFSASTYMLWQTERLEVPPGITGLWQLIGRDTSEFDERSRLDIAYIQHRCLWVDFQIIVRTIIVVLVQASRR